MTVALWNLYAKDQLAQQSSVYQTLIAVRSHLDLDFLDAAGRDDDFNKRVACNRRPLGLLPRNERARAHCEKSSNWSCDFTSTLALMI